MTCRFLSTIWTISTVEFDAEIFFRGWIDVLEATSELRVWGRMGSESGHWIMVYIESEQLKKVCLSIDFKLLLMTAVFFLLSFPLLNR